MVCLAFFSLKVLVHMGTDGMSTDSLLPEVSSVTPFVEGICGKSHDLQTVGRSFMLISVNEFL